MYLTRYNPFQSLFDWPSLTTLETKQTTEYYAEQKDGVYTAQVALPSTLDLDKITCEVKDNVLTVSAPVKGGRKVQVKAN